MTLPGMQMDPVAVRRELHRHPEIGFMEFRTAARVAEVLQVLGAEIRLGRDVLADAARDGVPSPEALDLAYAAAHDADVDAQLLAPMRGGFTAVVGSFVGARRGPTVGFRFDMDALPISESEDPGHQPAREGFASERPGLMHACGHDGHTAIGLGLATRLATRDFPGAVRILFQPAEEGSRGARAMAAAGVVDDLDGLFCLHLSAGTPLGTVCPAAGFLLATRLAVQFNGIEAHAGASPELGRNALLAAAQAVMALHALPPFGTGPTRANVSRLDGGEDAGVVPGRARLVVDLRSADPGTLAELVRRAERAVVGCAASQEVDVQIRVVGRTSVVRSDPVAAAMVASAAEVVDGLAPEQPRTTTASEDAGFLMERVYARGGVATYVLLGAGGTEPHHSPTFDIDELALPLGVDLMEAVARRALDQMGPKS